MRGIELGVYTYSVGTVLLRSLASSAICLILIANDSKKSLFIVFKGNV